MPTTQSENSADWGVLLVGHGTRNEAGRGEFLNIADAVAEFLPHLTVEPCFLEIVSPGIPTAVQRLATRRVKGICVMPLLLLAANHVKRDIPAAVAEAVSDYGGLPTMQAPHLGCHKLLLELSAQRYQEALAGGPRVAVEHTQLIVVGKGSRDLEAVEEMRRFVRLRREVTPVGGVETCFAAMAEPSLSQTLAASARSLFRHVIVQPHLLFEGNLLARVRAQIEDVAGNSPDITWSVAGHLGASPLLAKAASRIILNQLSGNAEQLT